MWFYESIEFIVSGIFAAGITTHFVRRRAERRRYLNLRAAYEDAVREVRDTGGNPAAVMREAEMQRAFSNSCPLGWFEGFGRCVGRWLKLSAALIIVAYFMKGPIERGESEYANKHARRMAAEMPSKARRSNAKATE